VTAGARPKPLWKRLRAPLLALLGLNLVTFAVYTLPRTLQDRSVNQRAAALRQEAERQRRASARLREQAEVLSVNAVDAQRFYREAVGTRKEGLLAVIAEVERAADEHGLKRGSRGYHPEEVKGAPLDRFVISMPVSGSYRQLVAFLGKLESSRHFVTIDRVQLREKEGGADLSVVLSAYLLAEEGEKKDRAG
jgi:Tfp pilus assembly protein PilO